MSRDFTPRDSEEVPQEYSVREDCLLESESVPLEMSRQPARSQEQERNTERSLQQQPRPIHFTPGRTTLYDRDHGYRLRESEIQTIAELGKFCVIALEDLAQHAYHGRRQQFDQDRQSLIRKGLVRQHTFEGPEASPRELLTLTRKGHRLLRATRLLPATQEVYHDFVNPRKANHDADLYRLYQKEAPRIEAKGGRNLRVILDYELKRKINRDVTNLGAQAQAEIAALNGLRVVRNKIPLPDLTIEYEDCQGEMARVNLELVTEHYRPRQIAEKVRAGFSLYTPHGEADRLRRVLDQHELTADILSL
jgi:hypothetical protein